MRTDTRTFRDRVLKTLRAAGVRSAVAKGVAREIVSDVSFYLEGRDLPARIGSFDVEIHAVDSRCQLLTARIDVNGHRISLGSDAYGRFVTVDPTVRQLAIHDKMCGMLGDLYEAGRLTDEALEASMPDADPEARRLAFVGHALYAPMLARYEALRDESLAINPWIHGGLADPDLAEVYRNCVKSDRGTNPRGHATHAEMTRYLDARRDDPEPDAFDDLDLAA